MNAFGREARGALDVGDARVDPALIEALADHAVDARIAAPDRAAVADAHMEAIARGQRIEIVSAALPAGLPAVLVGRRIYLSPRLPPRSARCAIAHEVSHAMLVDAGFVDSHGDVWRLTLAVMMPRSLCRGRDAIELAVASGAPWWAAFLRLTMTTVSPSTENAPVDYRTC